MRRHADMSVSEYNSFNETKGNAIAYFNVYVSDYYQKWRLSMLKIWIFYGSSRICPSYKSDFANPFAFMIFFI